MTQSEVSRESTRPTSALIRSAIWIAIGALIAAALVCVVWVLIGDPNGLIGRAFLTILLLVAFAGIAILEVGLAPRRPEWLALASMITWIIALLVGALKIWLPAASYFGYGMERFFQLLLVVAIMQLALLHLRLFIPATQRYVTTFTRVISLVTIIFLGALTVMLVFYLALPETFNYGDLYWRIVVALIILAAVGTTLVPLLNALFAPKRAKAPVASVRNWPTYANSTRPLPMLSDGTPDWNAYYTGVPTAYSAPTAPSYPAATPAPVASAPTPVVPGTTAPMTQTAFAGTHELPSTMASSWEQAAAVSAPPPPAPAPPVATPQYPAPQDPTQITPSAVAAPTFDSAAGAPTPEPSAPAPLPEVVSAASASSESILPAWVAPVPPSAAAQAPPASVTPAASMPESSGTAGEPPVPTPPTEPEESTSTGSSLTEDTLPSNGQSGTAEKHESPQDSDVQ